jgi:hypothetical protein
MASRVTPSEAKGSSGPPPCEFIMRWARLGATGSNAEPRSFVSRRVLHPAQWESRVKHKKRYRRRHAGGSPGNACTAKDFAAPEAKGSARHSTSRPSGVST